MHIPIYYIVNLAVNKLNRSLQMYVQLLLTVYIVELVYLIINHEYIM